MMLHKPHVTWSDLSRGYITSQFYAIGIDPVTPNDKVIAGGLQDNGNYTTFSDDFNTDWVDWKSWWRWWLCRS